MKYHELQVSSFKKSKRVGRGISAGQGKTAGRGTKGQKARTGKGKIRPGFEGGQSPLVRRMPKLGGFKSYREKAQVVYTGQLDQFANKTVDSFVLFEAGLITSAYEPTKVIVKGDVTKKVNVKLQGASASAVTAIQKAGGSFDKVERPARAATAKISEKL